MAPWDTTDARSTSISDGTIVPDLYGRSLRRALDHKMRNLRKLLTADEDITTELDRVVCRLMKLALRTSRGRQDPPPQNWMQCKLFDLLTLTEKSIERRRRHFIESFSIKSIEYGNTDTKTIDAFSKIIEDPIADNIVLKYQHLVETDGEDILGNSELDIGLSANSHADTKINNGSVSLNGCNLTSTCNKLPYNIKRRDIKLEYVNELCPTLDTNSDTISSDESECSKLNKTLSTRMQKDKVLLKHHFDSEVNAQRVTKWSCISNKSKNKLEVKHKNTLKTSKTKLVKKITRKKSSNFNFLKVKSYEYSNYKIKVNRKQKEHSNLQSKSSQPIPGSLIELCDQELNLNKHFEDLKSCLSEKNLQCIDSVAATKDSLFIGIVVDGKEETIALRRTVGTDPDTDSMIVENEVETVINITKDDSFSCKFDVEKVQSQTIFLFDINEPSTSKGIRRLSTDVQCGPDVSNTFQSLSATTSLAKIPKLFATGIKIGDSCTEMQSIKKSYELGTSTDDIEQMENKPYLNLCKLHEDFKENVCNTVDFSTMTENEIISQAPEYLSSDIETKLIKPLSSIVKVEDSNSENSTCLSSFANILKNSSGIHLKSRNLSKEVLMKSSPVKYVRPQLSFGGIHVHSFRDKQVSEDVVYQGEWQRETPVPKALVKKNPYKPNYKQCDLALKNKRINLKQNSSLKKTQIDDTAHLKPATVRNLKSINLIKSKKSKNKLQINKNTDICTTKNIKPFRNVTKVSSKITSSINYSKNSKSTYSSKKPLLTSTPLKKDTNNHKIFNMNSYIPPYLRKRIASAMKETKKSNQCIVSRNRGHEKQENKYYKYEDKRTNSFELSNIFRDNTTYLVYRNELESDKACNARSSVISDAVRNNNASKRSHSPQSQNSSTCSSPNSVATVRAASTRNKTNRKKSTSSEKSTSETLESDNRSSKNKKIFRRCKTSKKVTLSANTTENKENLSDSLRNSIPSNTSKTTKTSFIGKNKSVFMAQMAVENPASQSTSITMSKSKAQACKNSSLKIPYIQKDPKGSCPTTSNIECMKDCHAYPLIDSLSNTNNMVLVLKSYNENIRQKVNSASESSVNDHVSYLEGTTNSDKSINIESELRQIIEEQLKFIDNRNTDNNMISNRLVQTINIDSNSFVNLNTDLTNTKKVILVNNVRTSSDSSCDTSLENSSSQNVVNARSVITDADLLSFKSITSTMNSKFSEYFLADNELDVNVTPQNIVPNDSLVRDIYERKELKMHENIGGVLAKQAFSGFSVNGEPVVGDRPDYVNFVDSEPGSLAIGIARQAIERRAGSLAGGKQYLLPMNTLNESKRVASNLKWEKDKDLVSVDSSTSEEVFVSGRSSDTYESCFLDDDSFVPNWLFDVISQQEVEESEIEDAVVLPIPLPVVEPVFDINGNVMDPGVGVGAGAGDGRGMHSDQSQDSSGRGTSLSSSETSSGPESQGIISDPSAFTSQVDYIQEPNSIPAIVVHSDTPDTSFVTAEAENVTYNGNGAFNNALSRATTVASDIDADVSSLDTDAVDSDN